MHLVIKHQNVYSVVESLTNQQSKRIIEKKSILKVNPSTTLDNYVRSRIVKSMVDGDQVTTVGHKLTTNSTTRAVLIIVNFVRMSSSPILCYNSQEIMLLYGINHVLLLCFSHNASGGSGTGKPSCIIHRTGPFLCLFTSKHKLSN